MSWKSSLSSLDSCSASWLDEVAEAARDRRRDGVLCRHSSEKEQPMSVHNALEGSSRSESMNQDAVAFDASLAEPEHVEVRLLRKALALLRAHDATPHDIPSDKRSLTECAWVLRRLVDVTQWPLHAIDVALGTREGMTAMLLRMRPEGQYSSPCADPGDTIPTMKSADATLAAVEERSRRWCDGHPTQLRYRLRDGRSICVTGRLDLSSGFVARWFRQLAAAIERGENPIVLSDAVHRITFKNKRQRGSRT